MAEAIGHANSEQGLEEYPADGYSGGKLYLKHFNVS